MVMAEENVEEGEAGEVVAERKIYMCIKCGTIFSKSDLEVSPGIHCPNCGYRIITKIRTFKAKPVSAD